MAPLTKVLLLPLPTLCCLAEHERRDPSCNSFLLFYSFIIRSGAATAVLRQSLANDMHVVGF